MRTDLNFADIVESTGGSFRNLPAGNYVCTITDMTDVPDREYVEMLIDVAEGDYKDIFKDSDRPYKHRICLSYKDTALGMLKQRLHVISDCNPGFDAQAAFAATHIEYFLGKTVGVCFDEEEFMGNDGEVKTSVKPNGLRLVSDVRAGKALPARHKTIENKWVSLEDFKKAVTSGSLDDIVTPF